MKKTVVGRVETVWIGEKKYRARIDTGAKTSSIDEAITKKLKIGKPIRKIRIISAHGSSTRPVVRVSIKLKTRKIKASFNVIDRSHMQYKVLIGRNILRKDFLVDVSK